MNADRLDQRGFVFLSAFFADNLKVHQENGCASQCVCFFRALPVNICFLPKYGGFLEMDICFFFLGQAYDSSRGLMRVACTTRKIT